MSLAPVPAAVLAVVLLLPQASTAARIDEIREAIVRQLAASSLVRAEGSRDLHPLCVAFAAELDQDGWDPPPSFLARFADVPAVRAATWCRQNQDGSIAVLGPFAAQAARSKLGRRAWYVLYGWDGTTASCSVRFGGKDRAWTCDPLDPALPSPAVNKDAQAEDRKRILSIAGRFIEAWNRGGPLIEPDTGRPGPLTAALIEPRQREHTVIDSPILSLGFGSIDPGVYALLRLRLRGTFEHRPGEAWPLEPWKQAGALTTIELMFWRRGMWCGNGRWVLDLESSRTPWASLRIVS